MADGMSFLIQVDSDTPGLSQLLGGLDQAQVSVARVTQGLRGVDAGAKRTGAEAKELGGTFDKLVKSGMDPFIQRAERIAEFEFLREGIEGLLALPGELAHKVFELGEDALMTAAKTERMGRAFENALGKDQGKEAFEYFDAIADKTEFTHQQIRGIGLELTKSGFKGEGLKNASAAIADLASMSENPEQGAQMATSALQRIMTTGRIEARQLVPFGIQKGEFEKELSIETGLGIKAMRKELEAGKIPIETTLNSLYKTITNKTGEDLGGAGTHMTDTLSSRLTHLSEKPDVFFEGLKNTEGFSQVSDFVGRLNDALDPNTPLGQMMAGALSTAMGELGTTLQGIDLQGVFEEVAGFIRELPDDIKGAGQWARDSLVPAVKDVWQLFKEIVDFIHTTMTGLGIAGHAASTVLGGGTTLGESQDRSQRAIDIMRGEGSLPSQGGMNAAISNYVPGYSFLTDRILNPEFWKLRFSSATKMGGNDVKGYADGVAGATGQAVGAMSQMADATTDALTSAHEQHSPSALFRRIADNDAQGYIEGISMRHDDVEAAMREAYGVDDQAGPAAAGGGYSGPMLVIDNLQINVDADGAKDPYGQGRLAARGLEDELELMMLRVFEKVAKRMGSR